MRQLLIAAATVLMLAGCGSSGSPKAANPFDFESTRPVDASVLRGGQLYVSDGCQACHSLDGSNRGGPSFRNLAAHRTDRQLLHAITGHVALQPPSAALLALRQRPADARALVDFIESITTG